ncbi:MAG: T9SS type A sorting domain-containing protein [Taibaiella sp.]|nr:T9SS type A sorting domain-containing protein [Taibaiella sp.]
MPGVNGKNIVVSILVVVAGFCNVHAQVITTIAGNGSTVPSGDGGPATTAGMTFPGHLYADVYGNVFLCSGARVRKIDTSGIITNFAGGGSGDDGGLATDAFLGTTSGITIDAAGNHFFNSGNRVRKINGTGIISTVAGTGVAGYAGDGGPATAAQLMAAIHTTFDATGNMYITSVAHIRKVDTDGIITTIAGNNVPGYSGDGGSATAAQIYGAGFIAVDMLGNIYFADGQNNRIRKIDAAGIITTVAGNGMPGYSGDGGPATAASLFHPVGLVLDNWGSIYIGDYDNHRVRKVDNSGIITSVAGTGSPGFGGDGGLATSAVLNGPLSIAINQAGTIFISDKYNYRVRKITMPNSVPYFLSGSIAHLTACGEYNPIDALLGVMDSNTTQALTWALVSPPAHGTVAAAYTAAATVSVLTPSGLGYTPLAGYLGPDAFSVRVTDGVDADTITIAVDVQVYPSATPITGADTICIGGSATLTGPLVSGGSATWSSPHSTVTVGAGTGIVTGLTAGTAVISYTLTNYCGSSTAAHTMTVLAPADCPTGIGTVTANNISIFPNPNTGSFTLQMSAYAEGYVNITDMTGRKVKELTARPNADVNLNVPPGGYVIEVVTAGERWYGKVVVR